MTDPLLDFGNTLQQMAASRNMADAMMRSTMLLDSEALQNAHNVVEQMQRDKQEGIRQQLASYLAELISRHLNEFNKRLTEEFEAGLAVASFGQSVTFYVTEIGCCDPHLLIFRGKKDGNPVELLQHMSQLSLMLIALPRENPKEPRPHFGFKSPES